MGFENIQMINYESRNCYHNILYKIHPKRNTKLTNTNLGRYTEVCMYDENTTVN